MTPMFWNHFAKLPAIFLSLLFIVACSSNKFAVKPADLPSIEPLIKVKTLWSELVGPGVDDDYLLLAPAIAANVIYSANRDGLLVAMDRQNGRKLWKLRTKQEITGGLTSAYGQLYFGTIDGRVLAVDAEASKVLWEIQLSSEVLARPAVSSETLVAQTLDGQLYGIDRETGEQLWQFDTDEPVLALRGSSHPQIHGTAVLAGFANGKMIAVDLATGEALWEQQISIAKGRSELERLVDVDSDFFVSDNVVYAVNYQGNVVAMDIYSGRVFWSRPMSSYVGLTEDAGSVYVSDAAGHVWALDSDTGTVLWQQESLTARRLSGPTVFGDHLLVGDFEGYLHWLDKGNGQLVFHTRLDQEGVSSKPISRERVVYVLGNG